MACFEETESSPPFHTAENPIAFSPLAPVIFPVHEFGLVNFDDFGLPLWVWPADLILLIQSIAHAHIADKIIPIDSRVFGPQFALPRHHL